MIARVADGIDVLELVLVLAAVAAILGGLWRLWLRDVLVGVVLVVVGLVVLAFAL